MDTYTMQAGQYLSDHWSDLLNNVYIDKTNCGCGATTLAIKNSQPYVILVPTINLVLNKTEQHPNLFGFYGEVKTSELLAYLFDGGTKIICTYDSFSRVVAVLERWKDVDWKLLVDEAHSLINLSQMKPVVIKTILDGYKKFNKWVFVTATPTLPAYLPDELSGVRLVKLVWTDAQHVKVECQKSGVLATDLAALCKQHFDGSMEGNAHIFVNSVATVVSVVKKLRTFMSRDDLSIICSDNYSNKAFLRRELGDVWGRVDMPNQNKKVAFYTATAFEGVDLYDADGITYVGVDCKRQHTKLDICQAIPQIVGRIRDSKYKGTVKMLVCGMPNDLSLSREDWNRQVDQGLREAIDTCALYNSLSTPEVVKKATLQAVSQNPYYIVDGSEIKPNTLIGKLEQQRYDSIHNTYTTTAMSDGNSGELLSTKLLSQDDLFLKPCVEDLVVVQSKVGWPVLCKQYIKARESGDATVASAIEQQEPSMKAIYDLLGAKQMSMARWGRKRLLDMLQAACPDIYVVVNYKAGDFVSKAAAKQDIQKFYDVSGMKRCAKSVDIYQWWEVSETKRNGLNGYLIKGSVR